MRSNLFDVWFDKDFSKFCAFDKDWEVINKEDNLTALIIKAMGIYEKDIDISIKTIDKVDVLLITGKSIDKVTNKEYSINYRFQVKADQLKEVKYDCNAGLLYVDLQYKEPEKHSVSISKR